MGVYSVISTNDDILKDAIILTNQTGFLVKVGGFASSGINLGLFIICMSIFIEMIWPSPSFYADGYF